MRALKHLLLGATLLSVTESITATETLPAEDFESVINKGSSDFMNQFGKEKKAELGIEDLVEKQKLEEEQKLKLEQEAAEQQNRLEQEAAKARRVAEEAERERKKQEAEQKEKQEKLTLWNSDIETTMQFVKNLQDYDLTYGELSKTLETMKLFYEKERGDLLIYPDGCNEIIRQIDIMRTPGNYCTRNYCARTAGWYVRQDGNEGPHRMADKLLIQMNKKYIKKKIETYNELNTLPHPRWDEFNKM